MTSARGLVIACLALGFLPVGADAAKHETSAFVIETPARWSMKRLKKAAGGNGTWMLASPTKDSRVLVHVGTDRGQKLEDQFERFVETHLREYVRSLEISSYRELPHEDGLESSMAVFYGVAKRNENGQVYKMATYSLRVDGGKRTAFITIMGTKESWGRQALRFDALIDSFDMKDSGGK